MNQTIEIQQSENGIAVSGKELHEFLLFIGFSKKSNQIIEVQE